MKKLIIFIITILGLIGILALISYLFFLDNKNLSENNKKLQIIVTILPQKAFIKAVGGSLVDVKELVPPGGSPHTYDLKPSDLVAVERANIYFLNGYLPFEKSNRNKFIDLNPDLKIVDTSRNVKLRYFSEAKREEENVKFAHEERAENHNHEGVDPHIWLSPMQVKKQIEVIEKTLSKEDPANSSFYQKNAKNFKKQLDNLHEEIKKEFQKLKTDRFMVFHPAWGYLADEFGLQQIAIEEDGKEPTIKQLKKLIDIAKKEKIKVIFVQAQNTKKIAQSMAEEIDGIIVSIDPLSLDYINNLKKVAFAINNSLKNK